MAEERSMEILSTPFHDPYLTGPRLCVDCGEIHYLYSVINGQPVCGECLMARKMK